MDKTIIGERVNAILKRLFSFDMSVLGNIALDKSLVGRRIGLQAKDLLYLFYEVEKEFGIRIPEKSVVEGKFDTFNNIVETISEQLMTV